MPFCPSSFICHSKTFVLLWHGVSYSPPYTLRFSSPITIDDQNLRLMIACMCITDSFTDCRRSSPMESWISTSVRSQQFVANGCSNMHARIWSLCHEQILTSADLCSFCAQNQRQKSQRVANHCRRPFQTKIAAGMGVLKNVPMYFLKYGSWRSFL